MNKKRRHFSAAFKTKVALETLKERQSVSELAETYQVHPNQISTWKREFLDNAEQAFSDDKAARKQKQAEQEKEGLYNQIGRLKVENDWLKKKLP